MDAWNSVIVAVGVAVATNVRPWFPSVSHAARDCGLPETVGESGCSMPAAVPSSTVPNERLAQSVNPSTTTSE